jgi:hypothetical protein
MGRAGRVQMGRAGWVQRGRAGFRGKGQWGDPASTATQRYADNSTPASERRTAFCTWDPVLAQRSANTSDALPCLSRSQYRRHAPTPPTGAASGCINIYKNVRPRKRSHRQWCILCQHTISLGPAPEHTDTAMIIRGELKELL